MITHRTGMAKEAKSSELPRIFAELDSRALRGNYAAIQRQVNGQSLLPMVKADAYGHDSTWVAETLIHESDLYGFGVATLEEGIQLRKSLGSIGKRCRIIVFSGAAPWTENKGWLCEKHRLTPVLVTEEDWRSFLGGKWPSRLPYELKFNTGMNRLGLHWSSASRVLRDLKKSPPGWAPFGVFSHLAIGEAPSHTLSRAQLERFKVIRNLFSSDYSQIQFHLANSAAIWNFKEWQLDGLTDVARPGISLYGIPPWNGAAQRGIIPVLTLKSQIIARHDLKRGEYLGYNATYQTKKQLECIAIVASGYADGIPRALSNRGTVYVKDRFEQLLGIVSMDLCAISCSPRTQAGEYVTWLGPEVDLWLQAEMAGTIPYELLTSASRRVQRRYA